MTLHVPGCTALKPVCRVLKQVSYHCEVFGRFSSCYAPMTLRDLLSRSLSTTYDRIPAWEYPVRLSRPIHMSHRTDASIAICHVRQMLLTTLVKAFLTECPAHARTILRMCERMLLTFWCIYRTFLYDQFRPCGSNEAAPRV